MESKNDYKRKKTMSYVRNLCFVFLLITINIFLNQVCLGAALVERWDKSAIGEYVPGTLIHGELGNWIVDATIDETGDCGPYPHKVTIEHSGNGKLLRVISNPSNSSCVDNIWVNLPTKFGPPVSNNITISIKPNTVLSFEMAGALLNPKGPNKYKCFTPPCYDNISIFVEDTKGNIIAYVLRRPAWASPDESKSYYREIFLDEKAGFHSRNLYDDFSLLNNFDKVGSEIDSIWLEVNEHGWFTVKNIMVTNNGPSYAGIINWAESIFPDLLPLQGRTIFDQDGLYYRYYPSTGIYLGAYQGRLLYYHPALSPDVYDLGPLDAYLPLAIEAGF